MSSVSDTTYRLVCAASALAGTPAGWAAETLRDGAITLLPDQGGLDAIDAAARTMDQVEVSVLRRAGGDAEQEREVMAFAGGMPLIWVAAQFSDAARSWARERGPMTLLVIAAGALPEDELTRIARFVTLLARQTD
ncbi:MAG TPA: hypothetical protein VFN55_04950 [Solirubrobacteraceae bacterium]|nr:hypothetical protein [Solirubrobacteraceae bacterium]